MRLCVVFAPAVCFVACLVPKITTVGNTLKTIKVITHFIANTTHSGTRHAAKHTARKNTMHQLQHTSASKGPAYILTTEDSSFLIKNILTLDDGHIGRNMY
jgi:hypothetical protein